MFEQYISSKHKRLGTNSSDARNARISNSLILASKINNLNLIHYCMRSPIQFGVLLFFLLIGHIFSYSFHCFLFHSFSYLVYSLQILPKHLHSYQIRRIGKILRILKYQSLLLGNLLRCRLWQHG